MEERIHTVQDDIDVLGDKCWLLRRWKHQTKGRTEESKKDDREKQTNKQTNSETFAEVKVLLRIWMKRLITALGIVAVSKILSKLIHLRILLPNPPDEYINSLQKHEQWLCMNKKPYKMNRKTVHKSVQEGGLGIPHLKTFISALKLKQITKFINTNHKWKNIALVKYPFIKNMERCGPRVATAMQRILDPSLQGVWRISQQNKTNKRRRNTSGTNLFQPKD